MSDPWAAPGIDLHLEPTGPNLRRGLTDALVVGYGTPPDHAWSGALDALCAVLPG